MALESTSVRSAAFSALLAAAVAGILAGFALGAPESLVTFHQRYGLAATFVLVPLQTLVSLSLSPVPSDVVGFALALIHGFWMGAFLIWVAWMAGALIQFSLARRAVDEARLAKLLERAPAWIKRFDARHPVFLICGRWLPLGPHLVNTAAGIKKVPLPLFLVTATLGIAPVALLIAALASGLIDAARFF